MFSNKRLIITGGTGSFGNALIRRFLYTDIKEICIFSRDEKKQDDMRKEYKSDKLSFYIGDVRDYKSVCDGMRGMDYVFHAAALKQVPSCEFHPLEAVKTNIVGADNVFSAALENKVKKVIALSTDKAVYPINAMGISKAMMEKLMIGKSRTIYGDGTIFCCTRYGNVMCSRGSVIPLFVNQIQRGEDITITEPKMTRFLMSLDDAVNLVLYAFAKAEQGDILIQKAPAATIEDLARAIKEIFNSNINIKIIGVRHGEKLHETLVTKEELMNAEESKEYYRIKADRKNLNYDNYEANDNAVKKIIDRDYTSFNTRRLSIQEIKNVLMKEPFIQEELKRFR